MISLHGGGGGGVRLIQTRTHYNAGDACRESAVYADTSAGNCTNAVTGIHLRTEWSRLCLVVAEAVADSSS